jgi:MFS family permease
VPDRIDDAAAPPLAGAEPPRGFFLVRHLGIDTRPLRESPPFRRLFVGQAISYIGGEITFVAIPIQLYRLTHSTLQVGLLSLSMLFPLLVAPLVGGAVADAIDRRKMLLVTEAGVALTSVGLAANAFLAHPRVWALYALAAVGTAVFSFGLPALRALLPRIVAEDQIVAASALEGTYHNFAAVAGPAAGGLVIAGIGYTGTYLIDVGTFAVSLASIWFLPPIPPAPDAERASLRSIVDGFRYVRTKRELLGIFLVDTNAMIFGMPMALFPALGVHFGGASKATDSLYTGFLYAAPYVGALAASAFSGALSEVRRQGRWVIVAASLWGAALTLFGFADAFWLALALLAVAGAADFVSAVLRSAILLTATPDDMRGRMSGIEFAQVASTPSLGNLEAGVVASVTSLRTSIVSGGLACVAGSAVLAVAIPELWHYDAKAAAA